MLVSDFDFDLPPELIAQEPTLDRGGARLMHVSRDTGRIEHSDVSALPGLLRAGNLVVVNNSRVFPARLIGRRLPGGGAAECLLVTHRGRAEGAGTGEIWEALVHPGQKLKPGVEMVFEDAGAPVLHATVIERQFHGRRLVHLWTDDGSSVEAVVDRIGHMPLPPYIKREDRASDRDRYQTMFARERGSIAAPTAGLHFTPALIGALREAAIVVAEITLHVGYGTFQPIRVDQVHDHRLEPERFAIPEHTADAINEAKAAGRRVIAVGTTTTRTLEGVARSHAGRIVAGGGMTDLFVVPGFEFRIIDGLLTNFHLPQSSLLMLVSAFGGRERVLGAYREAVAARYRFYSYGDAMLIL